VGRLYRRICLLRSEGLTGEAQAIQETEFAEAAAKARGAAASEAEGDSMLKSLLAEEETRVAEAIAFAEVLVPILAKRLTALAPAPRPSPVPFPARAKKPGHDEDRGIADFIEDMLSQERTGTG
jgi:hypothetical protein